MILLELLLGCAHRDTGLLAGSLSARCRLAWGCYVEALHGDYQHKTRLVVTKAGEMWVKQRRARSTRPQRRARQCRLAWTRITSPTHQSPPLPLADPGSHDSGRGPLHLGPKMRLRLVKGTRAHTRIHAHTN
jgi:hypothetical protein